MFSPAKMQYRNLGKSGLKVSVIGYGNMVNFKEENEQVDKDILKACLANGINFFDTAESYQFGKCQARLGKQLKELGVARENIVVSTKIWVAAYPEMNSAATMNRKHIKESITNCLERLQMDYVDILFAHGWDEDTPIEEVCRSFNEIIEEGKAFYWGTSNWRPQYIYEAMGICERLNLHKPIAAQNQYNMIVRKEMEGEFRSIFENFGYGTTFWSPLGGGFLTGKYLDGFPKDGSHRIMEGSEDIAKKIFYDPYVKDPKNIQRLKEVKEFAQKELNTKLHNLALAWVLKFKYTSTAMVGARNVEQLTDSIASLELLDKLTPEVEAKINKMLGNGPPAKINFAEGKPFEPIRPVAK